MEGALNQDSLEEKLRAELADAVAKEEYERAAVIRDRLKALARGKKEG